MTDPNLAMGRTDEAVTLQLEAADYNQSCKYIQRLKS